MSKSITLFEALTGYKFVVQHLDGRKLLIQNNSDETTEPGAVKAIASEGMPVYKSPFEKGHLFIEFRVEMPLSNDLLLHGSSLKSALKKVLPAPSPQKIDESDPDLEHHTVTTVTPEMNTASQTAGQGYDDDNDEGGPGGHRVQCRQQ